MNSKIAVSFIAFLLLSLSSQSGDAQEADRVYKLYGKAYLGSKMRPVEAKSQIPFNKEFDQLTDRQMAIYRADFEGLKETDSPPFPKKGLKEIYRPLIEGHRKIGGGGELLVFSEINELGGVNKVIVYKSPSKKLADLATTVMFNTKFKPAVCDGKPCAMEYPFYYKVPKRNREIRTLNKSDFGEGDIDRSGQGL